MKMLRLCTAILSLGLAFQVNAAMMIDDFISDHMAAADGVPTVTDFSSVAAATAIGGERDLWVEKTAGADGDRIRARVNPNGLERLRHSQDSGVEGRTRVVYDGADGVVDIDFDGLGGVNLLDGSSQFEIGVTFTDISGPITLTLYDNDDPSGATSATGGASVPGTIASETVVTIPFSMYPNSILDSVGAILFEIEGGGASLAGRDADFSFIRTGGAEIPEPAAASIWAVLFGLAVGWKRRK